jgi:hypothetical protein
MLRGLVITEIESCIRNNLKSKNVKWGFAVHLRVYPEVSGLATWSDNCKWYSSLPLDAFISLFYESV